ncbi:MAG TPA: SusD/RagB family nutrient-binding outer membrane lipoprotein [Gemmatimonadaceae bacterium]|nr:SusD/RagB family nutrient-binding outer membrane lipoprotein [Gemmatimonadaceae bacterium]
MHMRNFFLTAGAAAALLGAAACNNDSLTSLNNNPNAPVAVPPPTLFTTAARLSAQRWIGNGYDLRGTEWVAQHLAEVQYPDEDDYKRLQASSTTGWFDAPYYQELEDLNKVIGFAQVAKDPGSYAPALVLRTWDYDFLTDTFGDVPYSDAQKGDSSDAALAPKYDAQKDIYADFFKTLTDASTALTSASNSLHAADPIYGGSTAKWQKFANSLHARLAMRVVNVDPAQADAELRAAFTAPGGVFTSNADNATLPWPGDGVYNNPWSGNFQGRDDHRMSQTLMNIMLASSDPRVPIYAQPTVADSTGKTYAGMPNGLTQATASVYFNTASRPGNIFYPGKTAYGTFSSAGLAQPSYFLTYAEVAFIQAEAAERGLGGLTPAQAPGFYNAAITASLNQWGVTSATTIADFLAQPDIAYKGGTPGLIQIATQKWIALYSDGGQAWAEWRRTCQPATLIPGPDAIINTVPRRFEYSNTEYSVNEANVKAAVQAMGGADVFTTRMWWDTNPTAAPTYPGPSCGTRP